MSVGAPGGDRSHVEAIGHPHGGGGFNPFSAPSIGAINDPSGHAVSSGKGITDPGISVGNVNTTPRNKNDLTAQLSTLQTQISKIRGEEGNTNSTLGSLSSDKEGITSGLENSNSKIKGLASGESLISTRIPLQEASIAECQKELEEAKKNCDMEGEKMHRQMLAKKKQVLQELKDIQNQVKAESVKEQQNKSNLSSLEKNTKENIVKGTEVKSNLESQFTIADSSHGNLQSADIPEKKDNLN